MATPNIGGKMWVKFRNDVQYFQTGMKMYIITGNLQSKVLV